MSKPKTTFAALIVAAGRGSRAATDIPKQYCLIGQDMMLRKTLKVFCTHPSLDKVLVVWNPDDAPLYREATSDLPRLLMPVAGGATRQASVLNGLEALSALPAPPDYVLIHDAARPFVSAEVIDRAIAAIANHEAAIPVLPVVDTIKRARDGVILQTLKRDELVAVQTPQIFALSRLLEAHREAAMQGYCSATDDASLVEWAGLRVATFQGSEDNIKMTTPQDFVQYAARPLSMRVGQGYDVHRFGEGTYVTLGGVRIPHSRGLDAHSDGDVLLHALTDAILGTIGAGDIGQHFPPSEPQWRGAPSDQFVKHALSLLHERGGQLNNADLTLIAEEPRIGPHRQAITSRLSSILALPPDCIGLKATTNEKMGFLGRAEGIAGMATVLVSLP